MKFKKLYALQILKDHDSSWLDIAYGHDIEKLRTVSGCNSWNCGTYDITNAKDIVWYSSNYNYENIEKFSCYCIREVPYVI